MYFILSLTSNFSKVYTLYFLLWNKKSNLTEWLKEDRDILIQVTFLE